jgi:hypothetical protein
LLPKALSLREKFWILAAVIRRLPKSLSGSGGWIEEHYVSHVSGTTSFFR